MSERADERPESARMRGLRLANERPERKTMSEREIILRSGALALMLPVAAGCGAVIVTAPQWPIVAAAVAVMGVLGLAVRWVAFGSLEG